MKHLKVAFGRLTGSKKCPAIEYHEAQVTKSGVSLLLWNLAAVCMAAGALLCSLNDKRK